MNEKAVNIRFGTPFYVNNSTNGSFARTSDWRVFFEKSIALNGYAVLTSGANAFAEALSLAQPVFMLRECGSTTG
jgi:hypothetical protein